jgi:hypothetical protein
MKKGFSHINDSMEIKNLLDRQTLPQTLRNELDCFIFSHHQLDFRRNHTILLTEGQQGLKAEEKERTITFPSIFKILQGKYYKNSFFEEKVTGDSDISFFSLSLSLFAIISQIDFEAIYCLLML